MSNYWGDLNVFFGAESMEEAQELFDRLMDMASDVICGPDLDDDHECALGWTAGGTIRTDEEEDARWRLEDAAPELQAALKNIIGISKEVILPPLDRLEAVRDEAERALRIAEIGSTMKEKTVRRRSS